MSRRKEANRAEAIVRGVGAFVMLLLLAVMAFALPHFLKGRDTKQCMDMMMHFIEAFVLLMGTIGVTGLVVWFKVLKKKK
jgi:hypothetical protein